MSDAIWIYGAAGHSKVIIQALRASEMMIGGVVDDDPKLAGKSILGIPILLPCELPEMVPVIIAIGSNCVRHQFVEHLANSKKIQSWPTVIHPTAIVDPTATISAGCIIMAGSVVQAEACIGQHSIVNTRASVDHDVTIGDFCHICPGATIAGHVTIDSFAMVGAGASVIPCKKIGRAAVIGAGACVITDIEADQVAVGVPAKSRKQC